jgi:dynein heavy chain
MQLLKFAETMEMTGNKMQYTSLGQGQEAYAQKLIEQGKQEGNWVLLQNCHLFKTWMTKLEQIVGAFTDEADEINPSFRLFLTSMPANYFPVSILQNGLKLTTEPPRGLKANLKRSYNELSEATVKDCQRPDEFRKLIFGLCFFHAVVQERRKFGPLGFNIRYEFNDSDLDTSITQLKAFLNEPDDIPWQAMSFVTGQINYGGRVTDDWDRILVMCLLKRFFSEDTLEEGYTFSDSGKYFCPDYEVIDKF